MHKVISKVDTFYRTIIIRIIIIIYLHLLFDSIHKIDLKIWQEISIEIMYKDHDITTKLVIDQHFIMTWIPSCINWAHNYYSTCITVKVKLVIIYWKIFMCI